MMRTAAEAKAERIFDINVSHFECRGLTSNAIFNLEPGNSSRVHRAGPSINQMHHPIRSSLHCVKHCSISEAVRAIRYQTIDQPLKDKANDFCSVSCFAAAECRRECFLGSNK
jgi:hypothetical protein